MTRPAELQLVDVAQELAAAVRTLSRHRHGAVLVWDPITTVEGGIVLDAFVSRHLLVAIFAPESTNQLRTGVTVIRGTRLERAAVPLGWTDVVERATELAAGVAIGVNEDTGEIRRVDQTSHIEVVEATSLARVLYRCALKPRTG